jgi:protein-disulfide isomerase
MALRIHAKPTDNALHGLLARECIDRNAENGNAGCHDQQYPRKRWRAQSLLPTLSRGMSRFIILGRTAVIACVLLSACAVQTGPAPQTPDADTLSSQPEAQHASSDAGAESSAAAAEEVVADPPATTTDSLEVPATQQEFRALTGSVTPEGTVVFGEPNESKPMLVEYLDYDCDYCRQHLLEEEHWINEQYVASGNITLERRFLAVTEAGKRMARAALCAGEQGRFHDMDTYLLDTIPQSDKDILVGAKELKLNAKIFSACMQAEDGRVAMMGAPDSPYPDIKRVPTFVIGGQSWQGLLSRDELQRTIEAAIR